MASPLLRDLLAIPYRLRAETIDGPSGTSLIRLAYPELPDCAAEGLDLDDVLADLERRRMSLILALVERGRRPPMPRPPLSPCDPLWLARAIGADARVIAALESVSSVT